MNPCCLSYVNKTFHYKMRFCPMSGKPEAIVKYDFCPLCGTGLIHGKAFLKQFKETHGGSEGDVSEDVGKLNRTIDVMNEKTEYLHKVNVALLDECLRLQSPLLLGKKWGVQDAD